MTSQPRQATNTTCAERVGATYTRSGLFRDEILADSARSYQQLYPGQHMVGVVPVDAEGVRDFTFQSSYPQGIFRTADVGGSTNIGAGSADASWTLQRLSSFEAIEQPMLYNTGGGMETLTNQARNISNIHEFHSGSIPCDSVPALQTKPPLLSLPGSQQPITSNRSTDVDSLGSTDENRALLTSDSSLSPPVHVTTLMLCNLPQKLTQEELAQVLNQLGFDGMYDLVYVPKAAKHFVGYGFVNFLTPEAAELFCLGFDSVVFPRTRFKKRPYALAAKTQGLTETLASIRKGENFRQRGQVPLLFNDSTDVLVDEFGIGRGGVFL